MIALDYLFGMPLALVLVLSLVVFIPLLLLFFFFNRAGDRYRTYWQWFVVLMAVVALGTSIYFMCEPYYSQSHKRSPGTVDGNVYLQLLSLFFLATVGVPSFPALFLLGLFPPKSYSQERQLKIRKIAPIGVGILTALIFMKYRVYMKDYREAIGRADINAYKILAFFAQSASTAVGTKSVSRFDTNIDIQTFGLFGGNGLDANHSYQFVHDAAETWQFYESLKTEIGFASTQPAFANSVAATVAAVEIKSDAEIARGLFRPTRKNSVAFRPEIAPRAAVFEQLGQPDRITRLDLLLTEDRFDPLEESDESVFSRRLDKEEKAPDEKLHELVFETLEGGIASLSPWQA